MPRTVGVAAPFGTLPHSISTKFTESHAVQMNINEYHDGASQRTSQVANGRRSWKISKRLDPVSLIALRSFFEEAKGRAFNFYNPSETSPPYSHNPIGASGLYLVRFNGDWEQTNGMGRSDVSIELIEVADGTGAADIGGIPPGGGPGGDDGGGTTPGARTYGAGVPIDAVNLASSLTGSSGDYYRNFGPIPFGGWMWAFTLTENDPTGVADAQLGVYKSQDGTHWIRQDLDNAPFEATPSYPYWDGVSSVVKILVVDFESASPNTLTSTKLIDFDMSTGLFSAPYGATSLRVTPTGAIGGAASSFIDHPYVFQLSSGKLRIVYTFYYRDSFVDHGTGEPAGGSQAQIYYQDYTPGVGWSSRQIFPSQTVAWGTGYFLNSAVLDGDVIHAVYMPVTVRLASPPTFNEAFYVRINADGTFTTPQSLGAILSPDGGPHFLLNTGIISGNSLLIPVNKTNSPSSVGVLVGSPKSDPTFTYVDIAATTPSALNGVQMYHMGSQDVLAYWQTSPTTGNNSQVYMSTSTNGGTTWSTPALALDLDVRTPAPVSGKDIFDINAISLGTNLNGSVGLIYTSWASYYAPVFS